MMEEDGRRYAVVANHEEQYSIWPKGRDLPSGWVAVGPVGAKEDCLDYIEHVWTDMRPRSLRSRDRSAVADPDPAEGDEELHALVQEVLSHHQDRVDEYAGGHPELFGWFLARVLDTAPGDDLSPNAVRTVLTRQLPEVQ